MFAEVTTTTSGLAAESFQLPMHSPDPRHLTWTGSTALSRGGQLRLSRRAAALNFVGDRLCRSPCTRDPPISNNADRTSRRVCGGLHGARELTIAQPQVSGLPQIRRAVGGHQTNVQSETAFTASHNSTLWSGLNQGRGHNLFDRSVTLVNPFRVRLDV